MAITKTQVVQELQEAHQLFSDGARKIFALLMKVQNMAENEVGQLKDELAGVLGGGVVVTNAGQAAAAAAASAAAAVNSQQMPLRTPHPHDGVLDRDGKTTQPSMRTTGVDLANLSPNARLALLNAEAASQSQAAPMASERTVFIPQMNTQDVIDAGRAQRTNDALASAKSIFKEALAARGLPAELADKIDNVSIEDINRHRAQTGQAPFGEAQAMPPQLPTEVAVQGQQQMPTEEVKVDEKEMMLACFIGLGSAFVNYLHADAMFHGKGDIKPGFHPEGEKDPIKRYTQDARWIDEPNLRHWPTGFYTDRDSKMMQLLVNTDQAAFLVGTLPSEVSPVDVFVYGSKQGYRSIQSFEGSELRLLHAKLDDALAALAKKK